MLSTFLSQVNWLAVVAATLAYFLVGALWYSPLMFAKAWVAMVPHPPTDADKKRMPLLFGITLVSNFASVFATAFLAWALAIGAVGAALKLGAFVSVCYCIAELSITMGYEKRPLKLWAIYAGYHLVGLCAAAIIIALWR